MTTTPVRWILCAVFAVGACRAAAADPVTFEKDVKPVFKKHCVSCHNPDRPRGELDLSSYAGVMTGGLSGKAATAGKPEESPVYTHTAHLEDPKMPPNKPKIPQRELDVIRNWVAGGLIEKVGGTASASETPAPEAGGLAKAGPLPRLTPVTALAVSPAAPLAAVPGRRQILLYDLASGQPIGALPFPEGEVHALRFSRDGTVLLAGGGVGGQSGKVVGFETGSWKRLFELGDETNVVLAADITTDKSRVVLGGPGRVVKVFSVADGKQLHAFRKPTDWVTAVGFSPEGLLVAAGDRFGGLFVWETKSGKEFFSLRGHTKAITGLGWRADSNAFASCGEDGTVRVWDMHAGTQTAKWDAHAGGALAIDFHASGVVATAGRDGRVGLWDATGKRVGDLGPAADHVTKVAFTPDAKAVVSGDWSGELQAWPVGGGAAVKLALPLDSKPIAAAVIPVPTPTVVTTPVRPAAVAQAVASSDLTRKRAALKAVEDAAEKLKEEAARNPKNAALAKAYLQVCEAALALKAEVLEAEAAATRPTTPPEGSR